jgi:hypothetical protein
LKILEIFKYFEIERDFLNKLGVLIVGDFKFGVLLLIFVRFLGGDTGNLSKWFFVESMKIPNNQDTKFIKKISFNFKIFNPFKRVSTPIWRNLFTKDDGNFTADLQNVNVFL